MKMSEWAKREVELACKKESPDRKEGEFDYGCACYRSALKAFESLLEDGHSGMSIGITKHILNRLIDGRPLTPIEDTPDVWRKSYEQDEQIVYQCERDFSLFKHIFDDGHIEYRSNNDCYCVDIDNPDTPYYGGIAPVIYREMCPTTMPYMPTKPSKILCHEFLRKDGNGNRDTYYAIYSIERYTENGTETIPVNRYFKLLPDGCSGYKDTSWKEIYEADGVIEE